MANIPGSDATLQNIISAIKTGTQAGAINAFVRVAFQHDEWKAIDDKTKAFSGMKERFNSHDEAPNALHIDSDESALHHEVQAHVRDTDIVIRKIRYGPFANTSLYEELQRRDVDTLVVMGFKTSGAVLSAVRFAADHNIRIFVLSDGVLDPDAQVHRMLIEKVLAEQAHVIATAQLQESVFSARQNA